MECPRCSETDLLEKKVPHSAISLDTCPKCRGIWFGANELELLVAVAVKDLEPPWKSLKRSIACPSCSKPLTTFHYPQTLVLVDMCKACNGIWLDGGELAEIRTIRQSLRRRQLLQEYAPVGGVKGALLTLIESAIDYLKFWA